MGRTRRKRAALAPRVVCIVGLGILVLLSLASCSDNAEREDDLDTLPTVALPFGEFDARAVPERFLAHTPEAALSAQHVAVLWLEPTGTHAGDTATAGGVDHVPYVFDQETRLTLQIHDSTDQVQQLVLHDRHGRRVARAQYGTPPTPVTLQPGAYVLQAHHARKGDANAPGQQIFLRPVVASGNAAAASLSQRQATGGNVATIEASQDCPFCDFSNADLTGHDFSGHDLQAANFSGAHLYQARFQNATLSNAIFSGADLGLATFFAADMTGSDLRSLSDVITTIVSGTNFSSAQLTGARFDGVQRISARPGNAPPFFQKAVLDQTTWGPAQVYDTAGRLVRILSTHIEQAVFTGASLKDAAFNFTSLDGSTFQGANLDGADFRTTANFVDVPNTHPPQQGPRTSCAHCSFQDSVLTHTQFAGVFLEGAKFTNAHLEQSTLAEADIKGADFSGTTLVGTDLSRADFSAANGVILSEQTAFTGAIFSDGVASGVNFADQVLPAGGAFLKGQNLAFSNLSGVSLAHADLQGITLNHANLADTNLTAANLQGADLSNAVLRHTTLASADLRQAKLQGIQAGVAPGNSSQATSFQGAYMPLVDLTDADLRSADLSNAHIYGDAATGSRLIRTKLDSADLSEAILSGAAFSGSLTDAVFNKAVLVNCTFNGANLANAKFDNAYLQGANFTGTLNVQGASFINAAFSTATQCLAGSNQPSPPCAWHYTEQDGTPVIVGYGATVLGALATDTTVLCPHGDKGPCSTATTLVPEGGGPFPPQPACIPAPPRYCNCIPVDQGGCAPQPQ